MKMNYLFSFHITYITKSIHATCIKGDHTSGYWHNFKPLPTYVFQEFSEEGFMNCHNKHIANIETCFKTQIELKL